MSSPTLEIQVPSADGPDVSTALDGVAASYTTSTARHLDGNDVISLVVILTPQILSFLAGLYVARTNAKKHVAFKSRGYEIKGVSEETLVKLYEAETQRLKDRS